MVTTMTTPCPLCKTLVESIEITIAGSPCRVHGCECVGDRTISLVDRMFNADAFAPNGDPRAAQRWADDGGCA